MAEIVYLRKGQKPPKSVETLLIEVVSDDAQESAEVTPAGMHMRVKRKFYDKTLADIESEAEDKPAQVIYVRGLEDD